MAYHVFKESEVNKAVLKKAPLNVKSGKTPKHITAWLELDGKKVNHLRVPNPHSKEFTQGKAGDLAKKLYLDQKNYKSFIECSMSGEKYLVLLRQEVDKEEKLIENLKNNAEVENKNPN